jgi:hypothetical protein
MIDPTYGVESPGVILLAALDVEMPQGGDQSSLALVRPNEEPARTAASYVLFLDANKEVLLTMPKDLNQMIEEEKVSCDEIFARWFGSCLATTYDNVVEVGHLQMACASRGLSTEENDSLEE